MNIIDSSSASVEITNHSDYKHPNNQSGALRTAQFADMYARQLREEFNELLYEAIARTDIRVAGRFFSLISELCIMTGSTVDKIEKGILP